MLLLLKDVFFHGFQLKKVYCPNVMYFIEEAGMLEVVHDESCFQFKNGATFQLNNQKTGFDFTDRSTGMTNMLNLYKKGLIHFVLLSMHGMIKAFRMFYFILFYQDQNPKIRRMISSILAGYVWDEKIFFCRTICKTNEYTC